MEVVLVKLGGSLITDKKGVEQARGEVLARLAREIAAARREGLPNGARLVLGHGSGSFGHVAAARYGLGRGLVRDGVTGPLEGVGVTQSTAAVLHRLVFDALLEAGEKPFSVAPSSAFVARDGRVCGGNVEPLVSALELDLLPVVYGDVIVDRQLGISICSTEAAFSYLIRRFRGLGHTVRDVLWLGTTDGVYGPEGETVPRIDSKSYRRLRRHLGGAAGTDVTGGMRLRVEAAWKLAQRGVPSWIMNGETPGSLRDALVGQGTNGTRVVLA